MPLRHLARAFGLLAVECHSCTDTGSAEVEAQRFMAEGLESRSQTAAVFIRGAADGRELL